MGQDARCEGGAVWGGCMLIEATDLVAERHYRTEERLALLCGPTRPTSKQAEIAQMEAETACVEIECYENPSLALSLPPGTI